MAEHLDREISLDELAGLAGLSRFHFCTAFRLATGQTPHHWLTAVLYAGKVRTTGGRDGTSRSSDGRLDIKLSAPGTTGSGTDPEQLLAAGWSALLHRRDGARGAQDEYHPAGGHGQ